MPSLDHQKSQLIFKAKQPLCMRKPAEENTDKSRLRPKAKGVTTFYAKLEKAQTVTLTEDKAQVTAWLTRATEIVSRRSDDLKTSEDKREFSELAAMLKESIPTPQDTEEDVQRTMNLLKQRIQLKETDSDHLKVIKQHLQTEIDTLLRG